MSSAALERLRRHVHADPALALRLRRVAAETFAADAIAVAHALECDVDEADIERALAQARQAWTLRWIR